MELESSVYFGRKIIYERLMNPFGTRYKAGHIADTTKPLKK
jgi:hypothetical protein